MQAITVNVDELLDHPENPHTHPESQIKGLAQSLITFEQVKNIVVWRGYILAGHGLRKGAQQAGVKTLRAIDVSDWDEAKAVSFMLADIRLPDMAGIDEAQLVEALRRVEAPLDIPGFDEDFLRSVGALKTEPPKDTPPPIDKATELQKEWGTVLGQLWQLGVHRLIVGDCTDRAVVERVMGGDRASLFLTDPPYGVSYADKNAFLNRVALGKRIQKRIENDHQSMDDMKTLWYLAAKNALEASNDTASYYWFACQGGDQMMMMMMIGDAGWKVRHELIWVKNNHVLGRSDYQYKHEPILYGWRQDGTHKFYGGFQTSTLEFDKPIQSDLHPTTKPLDLISSLINNSTQTNEIIYDPFLGSGTTLIACENLGRQCRAIEIDPGYAAVTLQRWSDLTGETPQLISSPLKNNDQL